jgi:hypothetical protein
MRNDLSGLQFSLASLMALMCLTGLAVSALINFSPLWASAWFTLTLFSLAAANLLVLCGTRNRHFWLGFTFCGWIYFGVAFVPWFRQCDAPPMLTTWAISWLHSKLSKEASDLPTVTVSSDGQVVISRDTLPAFSEQDRMIGSKVSFAVDSDGVGSRDSLHQICQSLLSLVVAFLGGTIRGCVRRPT